MESLLLIDALNVIRRIYEAIPAEDSEQKVVGATKSCVASIKRALSENSSSHAAFVMDASRKNWRHELYPEYKAGRKPMPEFLEKGMPSIIDSIAQVGLKVVQKDGYEADDVIGMMTEKWLASFNGNVKILSTDKDSFQLVSDRVSCRDHFKGIDYGIEQVKEKLGVYPGLVCDYLALVGDGADGVPGIDKVGPKSAVRLLAMYGDIDGIIRHADEIPGKLGINVRQGMGSLHLWKTLVTLKTDMSIGYTWKELRI